jgi:hypothetical protein
MCVCWYYETADVTVFIKFAVLQEEALNWEQYFALQDTESHNKITTLFPYSGVTGVRRCWHCLLILVLPNKKWSDGFKWTSIILH